MFIVVLISCGCIKEETIEENHEDIYVLELDVWNIYDDGSNPEATTVGINEALKWAQEQGYSTVKVPNGVYTIQAKEPYDPAGRINMVSHMTLLLEDEVIIQKEENGFERYELLYIGPLVENVTIKGGTFVGERDKHDYSSKDHEHSAGTHESGYGILMEGAKNVTVANVKAEQFTGDGLAVGGKATMIGHFKESDFEFGAFNEQGEKVKGEAEIRTKNWFNLDHEILDSERTIQLARPVGLLNDEVAHLYFYDQEGVFLYKERNHELNWSLTKVPEEANYVHIVFEQEELSTFSVELYVKTISENIRIYDSEFAYNRRQGITVGGVDGIEIYQNILHNMNGIAPQSGIDVEAGFFPNHDVVIRENDFHSNAGYDLILFDGRNAVVEHNYFGSTGAIGLAISPPFSEAVIQKNVFDGSSLHASHYADFYQNRMYNSMALFTGPEILIDGFELENSQLVFNSYTPYGIKGKNIKMKHEQEGQGLVINGEPIHLQDVTIIGEGELRNMSGNVRDGSIFERLSVIGYNGYYGIDLPRGKYVDCQLEAGTSGDGEIHINLNGYYHFEHCSITTNGRAIVIDHPQSEVRIHNTDLFIKGNGEAIKVHATNKISVQNNQIEANALTREVSLIEILPPSDVSETDVLLIGNQLISNMNTPGIDISRQAFKGQSVEISNNQYTNTYLYIRESHE
ncbi:right-handed parallel beta-helix repeat-containing protein [Halalkalibacter sp. AB-rgal2]|uniref:right-handed parallel beta-helix repeat-containing protein n=1 Tax=Halalkalibacter sp. AB-rgal2 TaxID=3242695 RepID=UPI00359DABE8